MNHPQKQPLNSKVFIYSQTYLSGWSDGSRVSVISSTDKHSYSSLCVVCFHVLGLSWQKLLLKGWSLVERIKVANMAPLQTHLMDSVDSVRLPAPVWIPTVIQRAPRGPFLFRVFCLGVYLAASSLFSPISICQCSDDNDSVHKSLFERKGTKLQAFLVTMAGFSKNLLPCVVPICNGGMWRRRFSQVRHWSIIWGAWVFSFNANLCTAFQIEI